jgi:regulator of cell morphogenesis and NO signaling
MNDHIKAESKLGAIVTEDFRAAAIFRDAGIDFCCGGNKSLMDACQEKDIDLKTMMVKLEALNGTDPEPGRNYKNWEPLLLIQYIQQVHHTFVRAKLPELRFYTNKIAEVHGEHHPELHEVYSIIEKVNEELLIHLQMEEEVLFPAILQASSESGSAKDLIRNEIERMGGEHEFAGECMDQIQLITYGYQIPPDACPTYIATMKLLRQFEDDLHIHVHLENNILFPKALGL